MDKKDVSYRRFMMKLSQNLTKDDIDYLKYFYGSYVPSANREKIIKGIDLFTVLERANLLGPDKLDTLRFGFLSINREDLLEEIAKQAAHLEDEFEEVQQSMQIMLEEYHYKENIMENNGERYDKDSDDIIEHDGFVERSYKVVPRHGNLKGKKLRDLEDFDEYNFESELQVDATVDNPQETAEVENILNAMKYKADVDDSVPDGSDTNQPDITSKEKSDSPQKLCKLPSETEDEDNVNVKGELSLKGSVKLTSNKKKSASSETSVNPSDLEALGSGSENESESNDINRPEIESEDDCSMVTFDKVSPDFDSDLGASSKHTSAENVKQPAENASLLSKQVGKLLPVASPGKEEDGPGGLVTPDFGAYLSNQDTTLASDHVQLYNTGTRPESSDTNCSHDEEHPLDTLLSMLSPDQLKKYFSLIGKSNPLVSGTDGLSVDSESSSNPFPVGASCGEGSDMQIESMSTGDVSTFSNVDSSSLNCFCNGGFEVQIPEGRHENAANGAKVIMPKDGMNFTIIAVNKNPFNAELEITYSNMLLGFWLLEPELPMSIEGPCYETGRLFYSCIDNPGKDKLGSSPGSNIECIFRPEAIKLYVETVKRQGMNKGRFEVLFGEDHSFKALQEHLQKRVDRTIGGFIVHNEIQPLSRHLREAFVKSGDVIQMLFSNYELLFELPNGQLLDPLVVDPFTVTVDDIKNYVQEIKDKHPVWQRLSFQGKTIVKNEELIPVFMSETPIIKVEFAEKLMLCVVYKDTETNITENTFSTLKTLKEKMELKCENTLILKFNGRILDDETKLLLDYGIIDGALIEASPRQNSGSLMRGIKHLSLESSVDEEDEFENLFGKSSVSRGLGSTSLLGSACSSHIFADVSKSANDFEEHAGKVMVVGNEDTNTKFTPDKSRTFQEELKVVISFQLVTRFLHRGKPRIQHLGSTWS